MVTAGKARWGIDPWGAAQDLCASVNIACGQKVSRGDALQKPRQQACQCQVCQASSTSLLRCGGGCRMRAHPSCVGLDTQYAVSLSPG